MLSGIESCQGMRNLIVRPLMHLRYYNALTTFILLTSPITAEEVKQEVYKTDWKEVATPSPEWTTKGKVMTSPNGSRKFLGTIRDEAATSLTLKNLPEHDVLTVEVELFLVGTWDGSQKPWGDDKMHISLEDQCVLLNTTFSNCMSNNWTGSQHYPKDLDGAGNYNCFTGASHIGELGYEQTWARYEPQITVKIDSTYKLKFSVPHTEQSLKLNFQSQLNEVEGKDNQEEQWYGIGKISVTVSDEKSVDEKEWRRLQGNLLNSFIPISNYAFWEMMRYPKRFRSDLSLLQKIHPKKRWWFDRAERLLNVGEKTD